MPEEPNLQKIKEEYPELIKQVPAELIGLAVSENTADQISEICLKNGVENEEKIEKTAYQIGLVLLGQSSPRELTETLKKEVAMESGTAEIVYLEVNRLIFSQVKDDLAKLYKEEAPQKPIEPKEEERPQKPSGKDVYRESVE